MNTEVMRNEQRAVILQFVLNIININREIFVDTVVGRPRADREKRFDHRETMTRR